MKFKLLIIGLFAAISAMACTKTEVPQMVQNAFKVKYPTAQKVEWEAEKFGEYEAEFKMDGKEMSANFKADGTWLETEMEIKTKDLPQAVKDAIAAQFPNFEIEEAEQVETPDLGLAYEVELGNEETDEEMEAVFSADGKLLKKEINKGDDEEEDNDGDME